jgi:NTP pyrophosphatase (non-canonical NTP hydrolase)
MNVIQEMQEAHRLWAEKNFPDQQPHDALLGITEEVGELCHAHLKHQQGIRGIDHEKFVELGSDALGDLFIYMLSYANSNGFDLWDCIYQTWEEVSMRDWVNHPTDADRWPMLPGGEQP